jgi:hypothetical protein
MKALRKILLLVALVNCASCTDETPPLAPPSFDPTILLDSLNEFSSVKIQFEGNQQYAQSIAYYNNGSTWRNQLIFRADSGNWDSATYTASWNKTHSGPTANSNEYSHITFSIDPRSRMIALLYDSTFHKSWSNIPSEVRTQTALSAQHIPLQQLTRDSAVFEISGTTLRDHVLRYRDTVDAYYRFYDNIVHGAYDHTRWDSLPNPLLRIVLTKKD